MPMPVRNVEEVGIDPVGKIRNAGREGEGREQGEMGTGHGVGTS